MTERKDIHNSDTPVLCKSCEARHRGVCGALNNDQLIYLSKHTHKSSVAPDTELIAADSKIENYSNIIFGTVKLTKLMPDGRQQIVGLQFSPDFLGRPFKREAGVTAEAASSVSLCSFPKTIIEKLVHESPALEHRLYQQTLRELDEARDLMLMLGRMTAVEKVATFLMLLVKHLDPEKDDDSNSIHIELPLKRADIADFLGLTVETVSRQITKLRKSGIIDIENNRTIYVPDISRLNNVASSL
jgi:CRP/FNR family transcriptional regulator